MNIGILNCLKFQILFSSFLLLGLYSGLSLSRTRKGPTNLFEIEKITVKIKIFTNKAREVNKGLLGMY